MNMQNKPPANIFVVVDPAQEEHVAFERAIHTASVFKARSPADHLPKLHVFLSVDMDNTNIKMRYGG